MNSHQKEGAPVRPFLNKSPVKTLVSVEYGFNVFGFGVYCHDQKTSKILGFIPCGYDPKRKNKTPQAEKGNKE